MLQFLQTIWLWGLAGLAVPIFIHLWNVKTGRTLKVGSIAFLSESARSHARSFKLSEWLLLLLRCLLIILIVLLMTRPYWQQQVNTANEKGWILIEEGKVNEAYKTYKSSIDSLLKVGYSFHYLNTGFKQDAFEDALKIKDVKSQEVQPSYWALLKDLHQVVPASLPVYLFTGNRLNSIRGKRPAVDLNLHWKIYNTTDTGSKWLQAAYETSTDSICVVTGNSNADGTFFTNEFIGKQTAGSPFKLSRSAGKLFVEFNEGSTDSLIAKVEVDTATMVVCIYQNKFAQDANYVSAAMAAIKEYSRRKLEIIVTDKKENIPANTDWLFWLSEEELLPGIKSKHLLKYKKGKIQKQYSTIRVIENTGTFASENITSLQVIAAKNLDAEVVIWKDSFEQPVLSKAVNKLEEYYFYSRFNPQWSNLVWSDQFPHLMYALLYDSEAKLQEEYPDSRLIDPQQMLPSIAKGAALSKQELINKVELEKGLWIIAFLLFLTERIIAHKNKNKQLNG